MDEVIKLRFEHGWRYFQTHAAQRMSNLQFAIAFVCAVYAVLGLAMQYEIEALKIFACSIGAISSAVFFLLDRRTRALVKLAESELRSIENELATKSGQATARIIQLSDANSARVFTYSRSIALLLLVNVVAFIWIGFGDDIAAAVRAANDQALQWMAKQ